MSRLHPGEKGAIRAAFRDLLRHAAAFAALYSVLVVTYLGAGAFVAAQSVAHWPSWQAAIAAPVSAGFFSLAFTSARDALRCARRALIFATVLQRFEGKR